MRPVVSLARNAGRLMALLGRLNPMRGLQPQLLRHYPIIWRTSVVHVLWYLALAYVLLYVLGSLTPVELGSIYSVDLLFLLQAAIWCLALLGAGYWVLTLMRTPLPDLRPQRILATVAVYFVCIHPLIGLPAAFMVPLAASIDRMVPDARFSEDMAFMGRHEFGFCAADMSEAEEERYREILKRYGISFDSVEFHSREVAEHFGLEWRLRRFLLTHASERECHGPPHPEEAYRIAVLRGLDGDLISPLQVDRQLVAIEYAKLYAEGGGPVHVLRKLYNPFIGILALFLSVLLVLLTFSRSCLGPSSWQAGSRRLGRLNLLAWPVPSALRSFDRYLLRVWPRFWATRIPIATISSTLLVLLAVPTAYLLAYILYYLPSDPIRMIPKDILIVFYIGLVLVLFLGLLIFFMRSQRRRIQCMYTTGDHILAITAFVVPWLPGLTLLLVGYLVIGNAGGEFIYITYITITFVAFIIYLSAAISYLLRIMRGLDVLVINVYIIIGASAVMYLLVWFDSLYFFYLLVSLLLLCYCALTLVIWAKNMSHRRQNGREISRAWASLCRYMVIFSVLAVYVFVSGFFAVAVEMRMDTTRRTLEPHILLTLTYGQLVFLLLFCRPVYAVLSKVYHQPAEA